MNLTAGLNGEEERKTPISCRTSNLGLQARIQNILSSWGHVVYPLLTL